MNKINMILFLWELEPTFYIGANWPKIEEVHISLVLLTFLCSSVRPFWKRHMATTILIKTNLKFDPLGETWS